MRRTSKDVNNRANNQVIQASSNRAKDRTKCYDHPEYTTTEREIQTLVALSPIAN